MVVTRSRMGTVESTPQRPKTPAATTSGPYEYDDMTSTSQRNDDEAAGALPVQASQRNHPTPSLTPVATSLRRRSIATKSLVSTSSSRRKNREIMQARLDYAAARLAVLETANDTGDDSDIEEFTVTSQTERWVDSSNPRLSSVVDAHTGPRNDASFIAGNTAAITDASDPRRKGTEETAGQNMVPCTFDNVPHVAGLTLRDADSTHSDARITHGTQVFDAPPAVRRMQQTTATGAVEHVSNPGLLSPSYTYRDAQLPPVVLPPTNERQDTRHAVPVEHKVDLCELAAAIAQAARAGQPLPPPRYISDLPDFGGAIGEWLAFRAAFQESCRYFSNVENTARLRKALKGTAKEAVSCLFLGNTRPDEVMRRLEARFGRPDALVIAELEKLKCLPRLTDNPRDICIFASKVANIVATVEVLERVEYLHNPEMVRLIEEKMTGILRSRWFDFELSTYSTEPGLVKVNRFLEREADLNARHARPEDVKEGPPLRRLQRTFSSMETKTPREGLTCHICTKPGHAVQECNQFKAANVNDRWDLAKKHRLCFRCLRRRNMRHRCKSVECDAPGCKYFHHRLLHHENQERSSTQPPPSAEDNDAVHQAVITSTWAPRKTRTFLKVLPVCVTGPRGAVDTYALLDDGSTVTLITSEVADKIGAEGPTEPFYIEAVGGARVEASASQRVRFTIRGQHVQKGIDVSARTIEKLDISPQTVNTGTLVGCEHLVHIADLLTYDASAPTVLVGQDNWELLLSSEVKRGRSTQPVASLTPLGWVLHGTRANYHSHQEVHKVSHAVCVDDNNIDEMLRHHFSLESLGVEPRRPRADPEQRALRILQETTRKLPGGGYETGLLWRSDDASLPNNYESTLRRLEGVEKKLRKDPSLHLRYKQQIQNLLDNGYAELAATEPQPGRTWYLPHFAVLHPAKPDKVRIVHDAAAKTKGVCLNDVLLTGPDLLQSLPGVLMRFRERPVAIAADIKDMFLRITVREEDRDALRFLWRDNPNEKPTELRMKSVIFGATSSPCTAIYVKNYNAELHKGEYPQAENSIVRHHYMDDYLESFMTAEEANQTARAVDAVHKKAKLELHRWVSSNPAALEGLSPSTVDTSNGVSLTDNGEKILGLMWRPTRDTLGFNLNFSKVDSELLSGTRTPTKRELLKAAMSLYDPLGLVTPVTIQAKLILQRTWTTNKLGWDDKLTDNMLQAWQAWLDSLRMLSTLELPRCYPVYADTLYLELHTFVDASETSYAAAVYFRAASSSGLIQTTLVAAKGRVAPLKITSIPRLELQAAVLGSRLARTVAEEHDRMIARRVYWTDSRTVLAWLRAGSRAFKPFVAHRVAEIEENTETNEWRWVPTLDNVADDATREVPLSFDAEHRWFQGPDFLQQDEQSWPQEPRNMVEINTGEEKVNIASQLGETRLTEALPDIKRFSSWLRLIRATARVLQFIERCRSSQVSTATRKRTQKNAENDDPRWDGNTKPRTQRKNNPCRPETNREYLPLSARYSQAAEKLWVRAHQQESFSKTAGNATGGSKSTPHSRLERLAVWTDELGVIHLRSRIAAATNLTDSQREPAVLDGNHPYTRLYIDWTHRRLHHGGVETVTNQVRQHYWVLRLRPTVRTVIKRCQPCRLRRATPPVPSTGNLPCGRLAHHHRPFTHTGLDYFGPLSVTVGRQHHKRYVVLFTCLTTRAVHLEVAASLSTDSAVMALRRMIARRGCPTEIWSDNGTNLRGADAELRRAALSAVEEEANIRAIHWRFIPPSAPFMGGAWERLVKSVKTALETTLHERHPYEETLTTLLAEVEHTVNSRPLSHVSTSPDDEEALTPNHFLLGGPSSVPLPGTFTENDLLSRARWRASQHLANLFWARWVREVLPLLQHRREPHGRGNPLKVGDIVVIADGNLPRNVWPRGIIEKIFPGADGVVRIADVKTRNGTMRRPAKKLVILPVDQQPLTEDGNSAASCTAGVCSRQLKIV